MTTMRILLALTTVALSGCYEGLGRVGDDPEALPPRLPGAADGDDDAGDDGAPSDDGADSGAPGHDGEGDAVLPPGRKVRRMTAEQFHRSLVVVTGQPWPEFESFAGAMGRADYAEITEEGRELSVTFDKFVHDAAIHSCSVAVAEDRAGASPATILRWADAAERDPEAVRRNLDYLMLRVLGQQPREDDPRVDPWMALLGAPSPDGEPIDDDLMAERWTAVCVGLVTHPDFLTY